MKVDPSVQTKTHKLEGNQTGVLKFSQELRYLKDHKKKLLGYGKDNKRKLHER